MFSNFDILENLMVTKIVNYFAEDIFEFLIGLFSF